MSKESGRTTKVLVTDDRWMHTGTEGECEDGADDFQTAAGREDELLQSQHMIKLSLPPISRIRSLIGTCAGTHALTHPNTRMYKRRRLQNRTRVSLYLVFLDLGGRVDGVSEGIEDALEAKWRSFG